MADATPSDLRGARREGLSGRETELGLRLVEENPTGRLRGEVNRLPASAELS